MKSTMLFRVSCGAAAFSFGMDTYVRARSKSGLGSDSGCLKPSHPLPIELDLKNGLFEKQMGTILACPASDMGPISKWTPRTG